MSSEEHRVRWGSFYKIVPILFALDSWRLCTAQPIALSVQQVFCQEDNSDRKESQIKEAPKQLPSRLKCAVEAVLINARFFAYNDHNKLCQTSFSSPFSNSLKRHWIMYKCTKITAPASQIGDQALATDVNDYFPKRNYTAYEMSNPGNTKSDQDNNNNVRRPVKVRRPSDISRGRTTKLHTLDHSKTVDTKFEKNRNVLHRSRKTNLKSDNLKTKVQRKPSRIVPRIHGVTLVVITTHGYIAYVNTDKRRLVYVGNLNWQDVIAVHYHAKSHCVTKVTAKLVTTLCLASGKEISKPRNVGALTEIADRANNVNVYLTAKHIAIHGAKRRRVVPVIRPLQLQINTIKRYVYCSCQRSNAVIIVSTPYWENRTYIIPIPIKNLNHFEIHAFQPRLFLCGRRGLFVLESRLSKEAELLVNGRCLHFTRSKQMMFAIMTRLRTTFVAQVNMEDGRRHDLELKKLPKQAGKFNMKFLPPGHRVW